MTTLIRLFFFYALFAAFIPVMGEVPSDQKLRVLYNSLDPKSISQHFAFYELYKDRKIGQQSLQDAWTLLTGSKQGVIRDLTPQSISPTTVSALVTLINKSADQPVPQLAELDLKLIESLSSQLAHHKLKGHSALTESEVIKLAPQEIDLARGLFLSQFSSDIYKVRLYEAMIDLMALQILARLPSNASDETKIQTINQFIFDEMGFRFPPHSIYSKEIDLYTFLPSVLDSRRGVCLGVSILYLCIAQRLALPLEMITPPGHIYVRYRNKDKTINIETTARGIHVDSKEYLGINTRSLEQRTIKEVIGLTYINQGAVFLQKEDYPQMLACYQKAEPYMPNDYLLKELLGYAYLFDGQKNSAEEYLSFVKDYIPNYAITKQTIPEDYLQGKVDAEGIKTVYKSVDEDRKSILDKKDALEVTLARCPNFRSGIFHLAVAWIQLHRLGEALEVLKRYYQLHPDEPEVNYYLAILYENRLDYNKAWEHLRQSEAIVRNRQYDPKVLKELRKSLALSCPE